MKINILLFGKLISISENREIEITTSVDFCTVGDLLKSIYDKYPGLAFEKFRIVLNQSIACDTDMVRESDEVALLPPICGGSDLYLTEDPITAEYVARISSWEIAGAGSVLTFLGVVRNDHIAHKIGTVNEFKEVKSLTYSAYEKMAEKAINDIAESAKSEFGLLDVVVKHRLGEVLVGETAFFVAVWSGHRKESIKGIDFIIDEVKSRVPIWKLENYKDGSESWKEGNLIVSGM